MASFADEVVRMRRYLRDPDGLIWDIDMVRLNWNSAQVEVAQKTGYVERAHAYRWPPDYTWSYLHDWEYQHTTGDRWQALDKWDQAQYVCSYPWEPAYWLDTSPTPDDGYRVTHPWEAGYAVTGDVVKVPLHVAFNRMRYAAFDEETILPKSEKEIAQNDSGYKTAEGQALYYYHPDAEHNEIVLYPKPDPTWNDADSIINDPSTGLDDFYGLDAWEEDTIDESDAGLTIETIDTEGQLFIVFESLADDVETDTEAITLWPPFMLRIVRYATLERLYGANTDGFIPSLRDYWKLRKEAGIKAVNLFRSMRATDRDYRLGGGAKKQVGGSTLRLPTEYPADAY